MKTIDYFKFLESFPNVVDMNDIPPVGISFYVNYVKETYKHEEKRPLIKIDMVKLSKLILMAKKNNDEKYNLLRENLSIEIEENQIFSIKQTDNIKIYQCNNLMEAEGNFFILEEKNSDFYYFDEEEKKNIKRNILLGLFSENNEKIWIV